MGGRLHRRCGPAGRIGRAHDASASSTHHLGARRGASTYGHRDIHPRAPGGPRCRRAVRDPGGKPRPRHVRWRPLRRGSRRGCCLRGRLCSRREGEAAELAQVRRRPSRLDGHRPARTAAGLAEAATRSGWESRLRVFYVVDAGLPRPRVNIPVFDAGGRLLGIADLLDEDAGLVAEFDGQHHRRRSQHREDNVREEAFESAGLTVVRVDSLDLQGFRQELARRLRDGHRRGGMRDRSRDRWTTQEPEWWIEHAGPADALTEEELAEIFG